MKMNREQRIKKSLEGLQPVHLELINNSASHSHHQIHLTPESIASGETHYQLVIVSDHFINQSRIDRQRSIMSLLKNEFETGLHALEIKAMTSVEYKKE